MGEGCSRLGCVWGGVTGFSGSILTGCKVANAARILCGPSCRMLFGRRAGRNLRNFRINRRARLNTIGMVANVCANHSPGSGFVISSTASRSAM